MVCYSRSFSSSFSSRISASASNTTCQATTSEHEGQTVEGAAAPRDTRPSFARRSLRMSVSFGWRFAALALVASGCLPGCLLCPVASAQTATYVELLDNSSNILATGLVYGKGVGPQLALFVAASGGLLANSGTPIPGASFNANYSTAFDGYGHLFVLDQSTAIYEYSVDPSSGALTPITTIVPGGFTALQMVTVDGAGNLFIADTGNGNIYEATAASGYATITTVASVSSLFSASGANGIAVDGTDNLYVTTYSPGNLYILYASTGYTTYVDLDAINHAQNLVVQNQVDGQGNLTGNVNVFVAHDGGIVEVPVTFDGSGNATAGSTSTPGGVSPDGFDGVTLDAAGNIYAADYSYSADSATGAIVLIPAGCAATSCVQPISTQVDSTNFDFLTSVTLDSHNNLWVTNSFASSAQLIRYQLAGSVTVPPTVTFPTLTAYNSWDTVDDPETLTLMNIGNAPLSIKVPSSGANPVLSSADFGLDPATTCPNVLTGGTAGSLASGASCTYALDFTPSQSGANTGDLTLTDNTGNLPNSTQTISLTGTGPGGAPPPATLTVAALSSSAPPVGQPVTITATVTNTTNPGTTPTGSVTFTDTVASTRTNLNSGNPVTLNSGGVATLSGVVLSGSGGTVHTITANYAGVTSTFLASYGTAVATLAAADPVVNRNRRNPHSLDQRHAHGPVTRRTFNAIDDLHEGAPCRRRLTHLERGHVPGSFHGPRQTRRRSGLQHIGRERREWQPLLDAGRQRAGSLQHGSPVRVDG